MPTDTGLDERPSSSGAGLAVGRDLTAVEEFSAWHEDEPGGLHAGTYRDLLPVSPLREGEQYAFEVDLDACTGCKACVTACHNLNGLDEDETWRRVGVLQGGSNEQAAQRTVTTACHHCEDPACLNGCPVLAYEKDPFTGIVKHLDDQCIGCRYCILKCPYDVPQYSPSRGIVRKCDLCQSRLVVGEAPACVQACPNSAIAVRAVRLSSPDVALSSLAADVNREFLPDSPDPDYTRPTTRYRTGRAMAENMRAGDHFRLAPEPAHWPLVAMLVLTEWGVGALAASLGTASRLAGPSGTQHARWLATSGLALVIAGLLASFLHLGQPLKAWRVFLGLRRSWLSREIVSFGAFAFVATAYVAWLWISPDRHAAGVPALPALPAALIGGFGLASVLCSAMIYHDTRRAFWRIEQSGGRFLGTVGMLGAASLGLALGLAVALNPADDAASRGPLVATAVVVSAAALLIAMTAGKLALEASVVKHLREREWTELKRSALLLTGALWRAAVARLACAVLGGIVLPTWSLLDGSSPVAAIASLTLCAVGELLERYLFFTAVAPRRMPGGV